MNARYLIGFALLAATTAAAACGGDEDGKLPRSHDGKSEVDVVTQPGDPKADPSGTTTPTPGTLPTASKAGEAFFASDVHPFLKAKCAGCHSTGGPGNPTWIDGNDTKKTYDMIYLQAYATAASRIVVKGVHAQGGAPELAAAEKAKWAQWIALEAKEPGKPAQANVLEKFGGCFDKAKFDAIKLGELRVTRRRANNNPQGLVEDDEECTGCRDNTKCSTCHSADDVTGFVTAIGNPIFPPDYTFEESKKLSPPFIRQYVGTTPDGTPTFNPGIKTKSTNTIVKGRAYAHPMFDVSEEMEEAIKAFVDDAIAKQKAGTCGK